MIRDAIEIRLTPIERGELELLLRAKTTEQRLLLRIKIVLEAAEGTSTREIAREFDTTPTTVSLWRGRYAVSRLDGLNDLPRSGTPPKYNETTDERIRKALDEPPANGFARWTGPLIAKALGDVDEQYVWRSLRKQKIDLWVGGAVSDSGESLAVRVTILTLPPRQPTPLAFIWRRLRTLVYYVSMRSPPFKRWSAAGDI